MSSSETNSLEPDTEPTSTITTVSKHWKLEFWLLCGMIFVAFVGLGVTQASSKGAWEFWLLAVIAYCGVGIYHATVVAKRKGEPIWPIALRQLLHWAGLLVILKVLVLFERTDVISREAASDMSLVLLALTCYLAGVHFHWMFVVLGAVLTVLVIVMATIQQFLWLIMVPVAIASAAIFYIRSKRLNDTGPVGHDTPAVSV